MGPDPRFLALARVLCIGVSEEFVIDLAYRLQEEADKIFAARDLQMIPYIENINPHNTQTFYNSTGTGAVVCDCGFATTFSTLVHDQRRVCERFIRAHADHLRRLL